MENAALLDLEELIRDDFAEYLGETRDLNNCETYLDIHKHFSWQWPEEMGTGAISHIKLRDGLSLSIGSALFNGPVHIRFDNWHVPLLFSYGVSGKVEYTLEPANGAVSRWCAELGQSIVACFREFRGLINYPAHTPAKVLSIYVDPMLLHRLVKLEKGSFSYGICELANGSDAVEYQERFATSLFMDTAIRQIVNCPYQGALQRLYLEACTLALLAHTLARLGLSGSPVQEKAVIRPQDVERVKYARKLISSNLQNPPTLLELARIVGLHHSKLNIGFREIYGTTIFGYLRQARLITAKALLDNGRMNVSEVAFTVGYANPSHFAKSFKDCYGTSPGAYLRTVSKKW